MSKLRDFSHLLSRRQIALGDGLHRRHAVHRRLLLHGLRLSGGHLLLLCCNDTVILLFRSVIWTRCCLCLCDISAGLKRSSRLIGLRQLNCPLHRSATVRCSPPLERRHGHYSRCCGCPAAGGGAACGGGAAWGGGALCLAASAISGFTSVVFCFCHGTGILPDDCGWTLLPVNVGGGAAGCCDGGLLCLCFGGMVNT